MNRLFYYCVLWNSNFGLEIGISLKFTFTINRSFDFLERAGPSPARNGFLTASLKGIATEQGFIFDNKE